MSICLLHFKLKWNCFGLILFHLDQKNYLLSVSHCIGLDNHWACTLPVDLSPAFSAGIRQESSPLSSSAWNAPAELLLSHRCSSCSNFSLLPSLFLCFSSRLFVAFLLLPFEIHCMFLFNSKIHLLKFLFTYCLLSLLICLILSFLTSVKTHLMIELIRKHLMVLMN